MRFTLSSKAASVKPAVLTTISGCLLAAGWERQVITATGIRQDTPAQHQRSYFTRYPSLRDETGAFCPLCSPEKRLALARRQKEKAQVRLVGSIGTFSVYDVLYFFDDDPKPEWKSLLVRTELEAYREIWHYQSNEGEIYPSFLVHTGDQTLLGLKDDCYRQDIIEQYFSLGSEFPVRVDLNPIWMAAKAAVPCKTEIWKGYDGRIDFPAGRMQVGLVTEPDWRCCSKGTVDVEFKLSEGRIRATSATFDKDGEFTWRVCR